ncbi:hypothetical protein Poli38472_009758 [Pythium oligandrum]|uniref:Uncharacterized protein n=1 Tax=Pythium oligandrum TaxID=41045 RepID=A0A8K1FG12_PYTOL|nr:hypothetical protein Poli38472_009758 [Pythium oligandrum]|eukprot:TMW62265.1 hypothetical protein Poli38472_009758 [Pythium oligandrum]
MDRRTDPTLCGQTRHVFLHYGRVQVYPELPAHLPPTETAAHHSTTLPAQRTRRIMKILSIKNRCDSRLYFVFCTVSPCKCALCANWLAQEKTPIVDWRRATYGFLQIEAYGERIDRFCDQWRCIGGCFFDSLPTIMKKDMLVEFEEDKNYKIGGGRAKVRFSPSSDADSTPSSKSSVASTPTYKASVQSTPKAPPMTPLKYLAVRNFSDATFYFVYCTVSPCKCATCQTWLKSEQRGIADWGRATYGFLQVKPYGGHVARICEEWKCLGACFFRGIPSIIKKDMLVEYADEQNYVIDNGGAKLRFTHKPQVFDKAKYVHIQNHSESMIYFAFCTNSPCKCHVCEQWIKAETTPVLNWGRATYGYLPVEPLGQRIDRFCDLWSCTGACFFDQLPQKMEKEMLFDFGSTTNFDFGDGRATLRITDKPDPSVRTNYVHVQNLSDSVLFFAFCTVSRCKCAVCLQWLAAEKIEVTNTQGWTVGRFVVGPNQAHSVRICPLWECMGTCFLDGWPKEINKSMLVSFEQGRSYKIAGGRARLSFATAKSNANVSNQLDADLAMFGAAAVMAPGLEVALGIGTDLAAEVAGNLIDMAVNGCVIS